MGMVKVNHASSLIIEDHLKKVIAKTTQKAWKASDNPFLPRSQHSAFGDFPPDYMPKKEKNAAGETIKEEEKTLGKTFNSKSTNLSFGGSLACFKFEIQTENNP
jgi:hypothetical protein